MAPNYTAVFVLHTQNAGEKFIEILEPAFLTGFCSEAAQTGVDTRRATEGPADVLDGTSRSPTERNAVDMPGSAAAVESP